MNEFLSVLIEKELKDKVKELAKKNDRSLAAQVRTILVEYLKKA